MTQPAKPLRICYPFVGDTVGGSHLSIAALIDGLAGEPVTPVIALHESGPLVPFLDGRGLAHIDAPAVTPVGNGSIGAQLFAMARCAPRLAAYLRNHEIDIVHTNDARMHLTWGPAARLAGRRFVWHQRSADDSRRTAQYSRLADRILTISHHCQQAFAAPMSARAEIIVEPFATDAPVPERDAARRRLLDECGAPPDTRVIGYVGNLTEQKRPLVFVDAAARLQQEFAPAILFAMFGEARAPMKGRVEARIGERGLRNICRLMGPRYPIEPWIAACDVLIAPAVNEGLGRTLVEAMLVGTPVVAADDAGHREVVRHGETGLLAAADEPAAFAAAAAQLLGAAEQARQIAASAQAFAQRQFSARAHAEKIGAIYRDLAA